MNDGGNDPAPRTSGRRFEERLSERGGRIEYLRLPALAFGAVAALRTQF